MPLSSVNTRCISFLILNRKFIQRSCKNRSVPFCVTMCEKLVCLTNPLGVHVLQIRTFVLVLYSISTSLESLLGYRLFFIVSWFMKFLILFIRISGYSAQIDHNSFLPNLYLVVIHGFLAVSFTA
jgi:hypothetical protein